LLGFTALDNSKMINPLERTLNYSKELV